MCDYIFIYKYMTIPRFIYKCMTIPKYNKVHL